MISLKFRIWDGKNMKYISIDDNLKLVVNKDGWELWESGNIYCSSNEENCKLMQFSGMVDTNGLDIYEGDIIQNALDEKGYKIKYPEDYKEYGFSLGEFIGIAKYRDDACWIIDNPEQKNMEFHLFCEIGMDGSLNDVKVIGNIFENKSLI